MEAQASYRFVVLISTKINLTQIAAADRTFLIDLLALGSFSCPALLASAISFFQKIFGNQEIIKIGWDFNKNDAKKLLSSGFRENGSGQGLPLSIQHSHFL